MTPESLLVLTHLAAFLAGAWSTRWLTRRYLKARRAPDGHTIIEPRERNERGELVPFSPENRRATRGLVLLIGALVLIGIAAQAYLADRDNRARDRADRAYAECLTDFAADLVLALEARAEVTLALQRADERKERALDRLISISAEAQEYDVEDESDLPPALLERYDAALTERIDAQESYDALKARAVDVRRNNPYVIPQAVCTR